MGLYWEVVGDEEPSPSGTILLTFAAEEGYTRKKGTGTRLQLLSTATTSRFLRGKARVLPGGAYNYIINGNMIAGFALVAYPATGITPAL
jgi:hypothetical protein